MVFQDCLGSGDGRFNTAVPAFVEGRFFGSAVNARRSRRHFKDYWRRLSSGFASATDICQRFTAKRAIPSWTRLLRTDAKTVRNGGQFPYRAVGQADAIQILSTVLDFG
jgi:hypothetical protein